MPGLQSMVSKWTQINTSSVEYAGGAQHLVGPDGRPVLIGPGGVLFSQNGAPILGPNGQPLVAPPTPVAPSGAPSANQEGPAVDGGGAVVAGAVDPRATTYAPSPQLSHHSGSSLSSYSFNKHGVLQQNGTGTNTPTTVGTTPVSSGTSLPGSGGALPSQRYPMYAQGQPMLSSVSSQQTTQTGGLAQMNTQPPGAANLRQDYVSMRAAHGPTAASARSTSSVTRSSRRSHNNPRHGALHGQLESYSSTSATLAPPPPEAGAVAILGRRKNGLQLDRANSSMSSNMGEPPPSLSSANVPGASNPAGKGSGLSRSPSSSLWHSQRKNSSMTVSQSSSSSGAPSVTASLDKMNDSLRDGHNLSRSQNEAAIAELNKTAESALKSMSKLGLTQQHAGVGALPNGSTPPHSNVQDHMPTSTIPVPPQARRGSNRMFQRRPIRKSNSRTDLVREMALDKKGTQRKRSSTLTSTSSGATPRIRNTRTSESDLDTSSGSIGGSQSNNKTAQRSFVQRRSVDFLSETGTIEENEETMVHSTSHNSGSADSSGRSAQLLVDHSGRSAQQLDSSGSSGQQLPQQQQQLAYSGVSQSIQVPTALGEQQPQQGGIGKSLADQASLDARQKPYGQLTDPMDRHNPLNRIEALRNNEPLTAELGLQWMQAHFPMPAQRRQSSSGSSGTAITGNHSLDVSAIMGSHGPASGVSGLATSAIPEEQPSVAPGGPPANIDAAPPLPSKQQMGIAAPPQGDPNCERCSQMESTLLTLQADLEYLRTIDLNQEFTCKECETGSVHTRRLERKSSSPLPRIDQNEQATYRHMSSDRSVSSAVSIGSRGSRASSRFHRRSSVKSGMTGARPATPGRSIGSRTSMLLRDASRRLSDLSTRHKRQVKQTTHERAYWQNDMHLKLEKFAMMCKNLNEEAAHRSNEVKETKALLDKMTAERNTLVSQVDTLKARVEVYASEGAGQSRLKEDWEVEKERLTNMVDDAGKERDEAIADLSTRLQLAVDTIESERKQQHMRRQIIFPANKESGEGSAPSSPHIKPSESPQIDDLERIQKSREVAQKAQRSLETAMIQSAGREKAMQARLDAMERELAEARATASGFRSEAHVPLAMEGRASLRRTSSTTSLGSLGVV